VYQRGLHPSDGLVETLDAFDALSLPVHPGGLKTPAEHLVFPSERVVARGLRMHTTGRKQRALDKESRSADGLPEQSFASDDRRVRETWRQRWRLSVKNRSRRPKMKSAKTTEVVMKANDVQRGSPPIGFWAHGFLSGGNSRLKDCGATIADNEVKLSYWQLIFSQSRANGCCYDVEDLPHANWQWPKNTWFQDRLGQQLKDPRDYQPLP
jgi:hypothetical protein